MLDMGSAKALCLALIGIIQITSAVKIPYVFHVKTSNAFWSGTDENMRYQFYGTNDGQQIITDNIKYVGAWREFERGNYDRVELMAEDVGDLTMVKVQFENAGSSFIDDWSLDYIRVSLHGNTYIARFDKTFDRNHQYFLATSVSVESCKDGFEKFVNVQTSVEYCADRDECKTTCKGIGEICTNTIGSYICSCKNGFQSIGSDCVDIDECLDPQRFNCPYANTICANEPGSYSCKCKSGYEGNPNNCTDHDECANYSENKCSQQCVNDVGSYHCKCDPGYTLNPDKKTCTDLDECALSINQCNKTSSVCYDEFGSYRCQCRPGYRNPVGNNKVCNRISCSALNFLSDPHVIISPVSCKYADRRYFGDKCHFTCGPGYYLDQRTSVEYVCTADGYWKGLYPPKCLPTLCPAIKEPQNGFFIPSGCSSTGAQHGKKCSVYCNYGYRLVGRKDYSCAFKKYDFDASQAKCVKIPSIRCPKDVTINLPADSNTVTLGNKYISYTSNIPPEQITSVPASFGPSYPLQVGDQHVTFTATNSVGDSAHCSYRIYVKDVSPPILEFCPKDLHLVTKKSNVYVEWEEPRFVDNVGVVSLDSNIANKQTLHATSVNVLYTASDKWNQKTNCQFKVNIKRLTCEFASFPGGDQIIHATCFNTGPSNAFCTANCPVNKTFDTIDVNEPLKNSWFCKDASLPDKVKRVPDCVDFVPRKQADTCPEGYKETIDYRTYSPIAYACGKCPRGTHYDSATKTCTSCAKGMYNPTEGQLKCESCPTGTTTRNERTILQSSCIALCSPGTYSQDGFNDASGCTSCPLNSYQPNHGAKGCIDCPVGSKTLAEGKTSVSHCLRAPAIVHIKPSKIEATEGDDIVFDCAADAVPKPDITWVKFDDYKPLPHEIGIHTITRHQNPSGVRYLRYSIRDTKVKDSGEYRCKAENSQGNARSTIIVTITPDTSTTDNGSTIDNGSGTNV